jgi:peptide/nickel transport system substrate-binding protein
LTVEPVAKELVWSAFLRGEIDMVFNLSRDNYRVVRNDPSFNVFRVLSPSGYILYFNLENELLRTKEMREAITLGINRQELIDRLDNGEAVFGSGPFYPESWAYDREVKLTGYKPERARAILKSLGYVEREGVFERDGKILSLNMVVDERNAHLVLMAKLVRQQLQEIGIRVNFSYFSNLKELTDKVYKKPEDFQSLLFIYSASPEPNFALQYWRSDAMPTYNVGGYKSPKVDDLIDSVQKNPDKQQNLAVYHQIHRIMDQEKPAVFLYYPYAFFAATKRVVVPKDSFSPLLDANRLKQVLVREIATKKGGD